MLSKQRIPSKSLNGGRMRIKHLLVLSIILLFTFTSTAVSQPVTDKADVVFVVDESGSMSGEHKWLKGMVKSLQEGLADKGIIENQYSVVGYGYSRANGERGYVKLASGTADDVAELGFYVSGGTEDGYQAIHHALSTLPLRREAALNVILVTDEDRDYKGYGGGYSGILGELTDRGAVLNVVIRAYGHGLKSGSGDNAIGIDSAGNAYIVDGDGGFIKSEGGAHATRGYGRTIADYVNLALASGGAAWDLEMIRKGGATAQSFTRAFIDVKSREIEQQFPSCFLDLSTRPKGTKCQLVWLYDGKTPYYIYRSDMSADEGFELIGTTDSDYSTFLDYNVELDTDYWYKIKNAESCSSYTVHVHSSGRIRNYPPEIVSAPILTAVENQPYVYDVDAEDPEGTRITYFLEEAPAGMDINQETGKIEWTPPFGSSGYNHVLVRAQDANSVSAGQFFQIYVEAVPNISPIATIEAPDSALIGEIVTFDAAESSDPDKDLPLTYRWSLGDGSSASGVSVTHSYDTEREFIISLEVTDQRGGSNLTTHTILIKSPNRPPNAKISVSPDTANPGETFTLSAGESSDPDGDPLLFHWSLGDGGEVAGEQITHTYSDPGTYLVTLTADDQHSGVSTETSELHVNFSPVFRSSPETVVDEDVAYSYEPVVEDVENGPLTYTLMEYPVGMSVEPSTGTLQWLPSNSEVGVHYVVLQVTDQFGLRDTQSFVLSVKSVNNAPVFTSTPPTSVIDGDEYSYQVTATDRNSDAITYSLKTAPEGMTIGAQSGLISWMPQYAHIGMHQVEIEATDRTFSVEQAYILVVEEGPDDPPYFITSVFPDAYEDQEYTFTIEAEDPENGPVTFSALAKPASMIVNSQSGSLSWTPGEDDPGQHRVQIMIRDENGNTATKEFDLRVVNVNDAPRITSTPSTSVGEGETYTYTIVADDPDEDDLLTYQILESPAAMVWNEATYTLDWVTTQEDIGIHSVVIRVSDQAGAWVQQSIQLAVNDVQHAPRIISQPDSKVEEDRLWRYEIVVEDSDAGQEIMLSLIERPESMHLDTETGVVEWTPSNAHVGIHTVQIRAFDGSLHTDQTFDLEVLNVNDPPVITSDPQTEVVEQQTYVYQVTATDEDADDSLSFSVAGVPGMDISASGMITWTPQSGDTGTYSVVIDVWDENGGADRQEFTLQVKEKQWAPEFTTVPPGSILEDGNYVYDADAEDRNLADILLYRLQEGPAGMVVDTASGMVQWLATANNIGENTVTISVTDGLSTAYQSWILTVLSRNDAPVIVSRPPAIAIVNEQYTYQVEAVDEDSGDDVIYSIVEGPEGATIDPLSGLFVWTPTAADVGTVTYSVRAEDNGTPSLHTTQTVTISVQDQPSPPVITSTPEETAVEEQEYVYEARAKDSNNDELFWSLVEGPSGMSMSEGGVLIFVPDDPDVGEHEVRVAVTDGHFTEYQEFTLTVMNVNDDPVIISLPKTTVSAGDVFDYQVEATDPDGDALTYILDSAPSGMVLDGNGLIVWPDDGLRPAEALVSIVVTDGNGGSDEQSWSIIVQEDVIPPQITVNFSANPIQPGGAVVVTVDADDPNGIASLSVIVDGNEVQLDDNNTFFYQAGSVERNVDIIVTALDALGNEITETFTLRVVDGIEDITAPSLALSYVPENPQVDEPVTLTVVASDESELDEERVWLKIDGRYVALRGSGGTYQAVYTPLRRGMIKALATAYDVAGNYAEDPTTIEVRMSGSDDIAPSVEITGPGNNANISEPTDLHGTANDANLAYYVVEYRRKDGGEWIEMIREISPVSNGTLGVIDPTILSNGYYLIRLTAFDKYGNERSDQIQINVMGDMKVGNFTLAFADMLVELPGLDLTVMRRYDSRDKTKGDFGFGWKMDISQIRIEESNEAGDGWRAVNYGGWIPQYALEPTKEHAIRITMPDGDQEVFDIQGAFVNASFDTRFATVSVKARSGTYSKLDILDETDVIFQNGRLYTYGIEDYNPNRYLLTMPSGMKYEFDQERGGLVKITDSDGESLTINRGSITHSIGDAVTIQRDARNRIISIQNGAGETVSYTYDGHGNLQRVTDQLGAVTWFKYGPNHLVVDIINPLGVRALRVEYNHEGRMVRRITPQGDTLGLTYDIAHRQEIVRSPNGFEKVYEYDEDGNITAIIDEMGYEWNAVYNSDGKQTLLRDPLGNETRWEYDSRGNVTAQIDALGKRSSGTYDGRGNLLSFTLPHNPGEDPADYTTRYTYDSGSRKTSATIPGGGEIKWNYGVRNQLSGIVVNGVNSLYEVTNFDTYGRPLGVKSRYMKSTYTIDGATGRVIGAKDNTGEAFTIGYHGDKVSLVRDNEGNEIHISYDKLGREIAADYGDGVTLRTSYDQSNDEWTGLAGPSIGKLGRNYGGNGELLSISKNERDVVKYEYDPRGMVSKAVDELGRTTKFRYDAASRLVAIERDGAVDSVVLAGLGRVVEYIDPLGNVTKYEMGDCCGKISAMTDPRGNVWKYSTTPTSETRIDPLGRTTTTYTSPFGVPVKIVYPDGTTDSIEYHTEIPVPQDQDYPVNIMYADGGVRSFAYDSLGRTSSVTDLGGALWTYDYAGDTLTVIDPLGEKLTMISDVDDIKHIVTYPDGAVFESRASLRGEPLWQALPIGDTVYYVHDTLGNELSRVSTNMAIGHAYDSLGRKSSAVYNEDTTWYGYDNQGYETGLEYSFGGGVRYERDLLGRVTAQHVRSENGGVTYTTGYTYDAGGLLETIIHPSGAKDSLVYDEAGRLIERYMANGLILSVNYNLRDDIIGMTYVDKQGVVVASINYIRNAAGVPTRIVREDGSYVDYSYDGSARLASERAYDGEGTLVRSVEYTYDAAGKRTMKVTDSGSEVYVYEGYKLSRIEGPMGTELYSRDANGRVTAVDGGSRALEFSFDAEDRLIGAQTASGTVTYSYDGEGRRIGAAVGSVTRNYVVAPEMGSGFENVQLISNENGNAVAGYVLAGHTPVARFNNTGNSHFYLTDAYGSVIGLADETGALVGRVNYDGFGNVLEATGVAATIGDETGGDFRFMGEWLDNETGLYHLRAREYDPRTGMFLSRDPATYIMSEPESFNSFAYAYGNPFLYADPNGEMTIAGLNVSMSLQSSLRNMRAMAIHQIKEELRSQVVNAVIDAATSTFLSTLFPGNALGALEQLANNPPWLEGIHFENILLERACTLFPRSVQRKLYMQTRIVPRSMVGVAGTRTRRYKAGTPINDGVNCAKYAGGYGRTIPTTNYPRIASGYAKPDFIISNSMPYQDITLRGKKGFLVGDIKLRVRTAYNDYVQGRRARKHAQKSAMINFGRRRQYLPIGAIITMRGRNDTWRTRVIQGDFMKKGLFVKVIAILK
ncbi:MAG: tandem-95 repeat protein [Chitinivibrionales bacterium]|nr:tandem-95 repeat protein [Chitinivibrionales bacterium]